MTAIHAAQALLPGADAPWSRRDVDGATVVRLYPADLFTSTYGLLVVCKALVLCLLALFGLAVRRRVIHRIESKGANAPVDRATMLRIILTESVIMAGTIGLSVSLGRTPPPAPLYVPTRQEALLGFQLPGPPTIAPQRRRPR